MRRAHVTTGLVLLFLVALVLLGKTVFASRPGDLSCTPPQAGFNWTANGTEAAFLNQTSGSSPIDYLWDFGDGATSEAISPTHTYAWTGSYTVSVLAINACGTDIAKEEVELSFENRVFLVLQSRAAATPTPAPTALPTVVPSVMPTPTPTGPSPTPTETSLITPLPTATPASGLLEVSKMGNKNLAHLGDEIVFTIALSNQGNNQVEVILNDTLPGELTLGTIGNGCSGTVETQGNSFQAVLEIPAQESCQMWVMSTVTAVCNCQVANLVTWDAIWWGGGTDSGGASSQLIYLTTTTPTPIAGLYQPPRAGP